MSLPITLPYRDPARLAGIAAKVSALRNRVAEVANQPALVIKAELEKAQALELSADEFQEFLPEAQEALAETRKDLEAALNARLLYEAEQAHIKAEQEAEAARIKSALEELAKLREAEAARQAKQARIDEETRQAEATRLQQEREAQEAELKVKREAMDAELKAQREEQARKDEEARHAREAEEARLQAEREAMERQRAELEVQQRALEAANAAKVTKLPKRGKKAADPLDDLKQALNANAETARALDAAYQRGFQAGLNSAQQAA